MFIFRICRIAQNTFWNLAGLTYLDVFFGVCVFVIFMRIYIVLVYWNQPKESTSMLHVCFLQWSNHSFVVIVTKKRGWPTIAGKIYEEKQGEVDNYLLQLSWKYTIIVFENEMDSRFFIPLFQNNTQQSGRQKQMEMKIKISVDWKKLNTNQQSDVKMYKFCCWSHLWKNITTNSWDQRR